MRLLVVGLLVCLTSMLCACGSDAGGEAPPAATLSAANCGPEDKPELGLQGRVSKSDRDSGRSQQGYSCNLKLIGQYQAEGASWVNPSSQDCAYLATAFTGLLVKQSPGVQVIDVSDPHAPKLSTILTAPAMLTGPWESLKINETRGLLAGVSGGPILSAGLFDVYDISEDCANPIHRNQVAGSGLSLPADGLGHEGNWSPDGLTYWATGVVAGAITAIDVSNPAAPRIVYSSIGSFFGNHGLEISPDGNRMYLSISNPSGVAILDISDVQQRALVPIVREIGVAEWGSEGNVQQPTLVLYNDHPYLIVTDEFNNQGVRIVDIGDETQPEVIAHVQLQIQHPDAAGLRAEDLSNNGFFGYEAHYCEVDRRNNPTAMACGFFQSGIRVFDIRNPRSPKEIAYFNPPAQVGQGWRLAGSEHAVGVGLLPSLSDNSANPIDRVGGYIVDLSRQGTNSLTADWCSSPPRFVAPDQLWVSCQDNGFMVLQFTNGAYPL